MRLPKNFQPVGTWQQAGPPGARQGTSTLPDCYLLWHTGSQPRTWMSRSVEGTQSHDGPWCPWGARAASGCRLPRDSKVLTSKNLSPRPVATTSSAAEVGMLRATPLSPAAKYGMLSTALAAMMATESEGVTKNLQGQAQGSLWFRDVHRSTARLKDVHTSTAVREGGKLCSLGGLRCSTQRKEIRQGTSDSLVPCTDGSYTWSGARSCPVPGRFKKQQMRHLLPRIMFLSASPSQAAPNSGGSAEGCSLPSPMAFTSSLAYVRLGSGWPPPKSSCSRRSNRADRRQTRAKCSVAIIQQRACGPEERNVCPCRSQVLACTGRMVMPSHATCLGDAVDQSRGIHPQLLHK